MTVNTRCKVLTLLVVLMLTLISFSFVSTVNAAFKELPEDGMWIDEFENADDITDNSDCFVDIANKTVELQQGDPVIDYNTKDYPDNIDMWYHDQTIVPTGGLGEILASFVNPSVLPGTPVEDQDKELFGELDGDYKETASYKLTGEDIYVCRPMHHFRFKINQDPVNIKKFTVKWWYGEYHSKANLKDIYAYIWRYGEILEYWGEQGKITYSSSNVGMGDPNIEFSISNGEYIDSDGYMDILIVGIPSTNDKNAYLRTDKIEVTVETKYGYQDEGYIISSVIEPSNFGGWERVIWSGSKPSDNTNITIQVLDENKKLITGFSSKTSPMDISSITQKRIRLKAVLRSKTPDSTPKLYRWCIMYQKDDGYTDTFKYEYRIGEKLGVKFTDEKIKVSEFYSDWEIFGKNPDNTRSYEGENLIEKPDGYYWFTEEDVVGGGFRAPVVSEGKVYVASIDKKIYAFDTYTDDPGYEQYPVDHSIQASYVVDTSLGVSDGYVIVPTADTKNKENKIYALNSSNLSYVKWEYSHGGSICFSSAPTIDNGRIFITSWSGNIWETPLLSFLNKFLGGNNKLIALDLTTGDPLWKPKTLPAGSFSSPAVTDDLVYVGCQNMYGSNLFAYDIETGENVWNVSVGIIGKASPVYYNDKLFVLCREKKSITKSGENKIVALNAKTGETLWNKTIGDKPFAAALLNIFRRLSFSRAVFDDAPIASPAAKDDMLFVVAPDGRLYGIDVANGETIWSSNVTIGLINSGYYTASPVVVGDYVYVINGFGVVYAFDANSEGDDVEPEWSYQMETPELVMFGGAYPDVIASPIVSDGLLMVSVTENTSALTGRVYCIGEYTKNDKGWATSSTIHIPTGFWWEEFNTDKINTTNNTVVFSILDENNQVLTSKNGQNYENLNGSHNNLTDLTSNVIKLRADFKIKNETEDHLALDRWDVSWVPESGKPEFDNDSFEPGNDGWVNQNIKECSIEVSDREYNGILSGLDISSAMFQLEYIKQDETSVKTSDWTTATCIPENSGVAKTRMYANLSGFKISELKNITFKIKDLAGNVNNTRKTFKMDGIKPTSAIVNIGSFEDIYNDEIVISAEAGDSGGSGVDTVALKYSYREKEEDDWSEWITYQEAESPYSWYFGKDLVSGNPLDSGYYRLTTIAKDNASNEQDTNSNNIISFLFDITKPSLENDFDDDYKTRSIPTFELKIADDFLLESISFKPGFETEWTEIKTGIQQETYTHKWKFPEEYWEQISEGQGHYIYFKIIDYCGNIKETTTQNTLYLVKDENVAEFYVDLTSFKEWHWDDQFTVTANIPDDIDVENVTLYYCYSEDNNNWNEWQQYGEKLTSAPYTWAFTASGGSGYYKFKTEITDTQGAVYTSPVETINVTLFPTILFIILIILAFFSILISLLAISKMRKKHNN